MIFFIPFRFKWFATPEAIDPQSQLTTEAAPDAVSLTSDPSDRSEPTASRFDAADFNAADFDAADLALSDSRPNHRAAQAAIAKVRQVRAEHALVRRLFL